MTWLAAFLLLFSGYSSKDAPVVRTATFLRWLTKHGRVHELKSVGIDKYRLVETRFDITSLEMLFESFSPLQFVRGEVVVEKSHLEHNALDALALKEVAPCIPLDVA